MDYPLLFLTLLLLLLRENALAYFVLLEPSAISEPLNNTNPVCVYTKDLAEKWYGPDGPIRFYSHEDAANVSINIYYDPYAFKDTTLNDSIHLNGPGDYCFKVNATAQQPANVTTQKAYLWLNYTSARGSFYHCSHVTLSKNRSVAKPDCTGSLTPVYHSGFALNENDPTLNNAAIKQEPIVFLVALLIVFSSISTVML